MAGLRMRATTGLQRGDPAVSAARHTNLPMCLRCSRWTSSSSRFR
jgi:hypothetical protein